MTSAIVQTVRLDNLQSVPNADNLQYTQIGGYQVITRSGQFKVGDLALFVSVDSVLPEEFLKHYDLQDIIPKGRIKTKKLRGMYSQGLILPLTYPGMENATEGTDYAVVTGIKKYEPPVKAISVRAHPWPHHALHKFDIESIQNPKYLDLFHEEIFVVMTEKVHGRHIQVHFIDGKTGVASRNVNLRPPEPRQEGSDTQEVSEYWEAVIRLGLVQKVQDIAHYLDADTPPCVVIHGELFGKNMQFMDYGIDSTDIIVFDIEVLWSGKTEFQFLDFDIFTHICRHFHIKQAPVLYRGPYSFSKVQEMAEQSSVVSKKHNDLQEGVVIKPEQEMTIYPLGRLLLKYVSKKFSAKLADSPEAADAVMVAQ